MTGSGLTMVENVAALGTLVARVGRVSTELNKNSRVDRVGCANSFYQQRQVKLDRTWEGKGNDKTSKLQPYMLAPFSKDVKDSFQ